MMNWLNQNAGALGALGGLAGALSALAAVATFWLMWWLGREQLRPQLKVADATLASFKTQQELAEATIRSFKTQQDVAEVQLREFHSRALDEILGRSREALERLREEFGADIHSFHFSYPEFLYAIQQTNSLPEKHSKTGPLRAATAKWLGSRPVDYVSLAAHLTDCGGVRTLETRSADQVLACLSLDEGFRTTAEAILKGTEDEIARAAAAVPDGMRQSLTADALARARLQLDTACDLARASLPGFGATCSSGPAPSQPSNASTASASVATSA